MTRGNRTLFDNPLLSSIDQVRQAGIGDIRIIAEQRMPRPALNECPFFGSYLFFVFLLGFSTDLVFITLFIITPSLACCFPSAISFVCC
jgi:hypothetical protein